MFRLAVLAAMLAAFGFAFAGLWNRPLAGAAGTVGALPPAERRPPGVPPSAKWLPESPRYQAARREAFRKTQDAAARLDLGKTRVAREARYRVTIVDRPEPVLLQEFQDWTLRVVDGAGRPVAGALLNIGGGMPRHGHGLPTQPKTAATGTPGEYRVEGLQFSMPGWWEVHVYVSKDHVEDIATFNLLLE